MKRWQMPVLTSAARLQHGHYYDQDSYSYSYSYSQPSRATHCITMCFSNDCDHQHVPVMYRVAPVKSP